MADKDSTLTQKYLKEILHYDPQTGVFTRKVTASHYKAGSTAGHEWKNSSGKMYRTIIIKQRHYLEHRLAFFYMTGKWPKHQIDHADGNGLNNKWANLSETTNTGNQKNRRLSKNNNSGYIGVSYSKANRNWYSRIWVDGKKKHLGCFKNKEDAIKARKNAEIEYGYHQNHGSKRPL